MAKTTEPTRRDADAAHDQLAHDPHRPIYHFLPKANWMNDPNGLIHWNGQYHMFYQYNPDGAYHANMHWGHAISADLVHWEHLPVALVPTPATPDAEGCYSGCAVDHNGVPTIIYSGHNRANPGQYQLPCLATGDDALRTLTKYAGNPIIPGPPPDLDLIGFRDHCVWKEGNTWYQVIGAGIAGVGGTTLLYKSPDLLRWEYVQPICVGDLHETTPLWTGSMWECPDLFPLDGQHVLIVSVWDNRHTHYAIAFVGAYTEHRFAPGPPHKLDYGASFYAPQSLRDAAGRRIMFGWLREERDDQAQRAAGWSGVMSLPRILSLEPGGLSMRPAPELTQLRRKHVQARALNVSSASRALANVRGDSLEIAIAISLGDDDDVGLILRASPDGTEQTRLVYDRAANQLTLDTTQSSLSAGARGGRHSGPLTLAPDELLRLHIFIDRSVIEVFANERACVTGRVYPTRADSLGLDLLVQTGSATVAELDVWALGSIWDNAS